MTNRSTSRHSAFARFSAAGVVGLAHVGLFLLLGDVQTDRRFVPPGVPIVVDLVRPAPVPLPPPRTPTQSMGGGAPAAPSVVRPARPRPLQPPPEIKAPPRPAPEQPLVTGAAPSGLAAPVAGQGGQGAGEGGGVGTGMGPGAGDGRFRLLRGPTLGELRRLHPPEAFRQRMGGQGVLSCRIRLDTRLEGCRVVDEAPPGMGFGAAALAASVYFRFQPATHDGAPVDGQEVPVTVLWP